MNSARALEDRVALVIGGSRNLGAEIADHVAARGATTIISYAHDDAEAVRTRRRLERHGGQVEAVRSDARDAAAVAALVGDVVRHHDRLDIVVHVAGAVIKKPLLDTSDDDFDLLIDRNTRSVFNSLRASARHLSDGGRYVALSTTLTSIMTGPYGVYSASKAAVERLVLAAAKELAPRGITVNAVAPGPVDDDFYRAVETQESIAAASRHSPRNRLGEPSDVAPVVGWLVNEGAAWVSGQTIRVNGAMF